MPLFNTLSLSAIQEYSTKNRLSFNLSVFFLEVITAMNPMKTMLEKLKGCEEPSFPFLSFKEASYTESPTEEVFVNYNQDDEGRLITRAEYAYENEAKLYDLLDCLYAEEEAQELYEHMTKDSFFKERIMSMPLSKILNDELTIPLIETMLGEGFCITKSYEQQDDLDKHQLVRFVTYSVSYVEGYAPFFSSPSGNPFPAAEGVKIKGFPCISYPPVIRPSWLATGESYYFPWCQKCYSDTDGPLSYPFLCSRPECSML
jgi:hypothetical protein